MESSFVKKKGAASPFSCEKLPPGTRISPFNRALLTSTGLASLDSILGGGLCVGSILLIEEDAYAAHFDLLLKYLAAEGAACNQTLYVASASADREEADQWVRSLPVAASSATPVAADDPFFRIAWQYQKYNRRNPTSSVSWCHKFDWSRSLNDAGPHGPSYHAFCHPLTLEIQLPERHPYLSLYSDLKEKIDSANRSTLENTDLRVQRILVRSIGSHWAASPASCETETVTWLRALRGLIRRSSAVAIVSFPAYLWQGDSRSKNTEFVNHVRHAADVVVQLISFSDADSPVNPAFTPFDGLLKLVKTPKVGVAHVAAITSYTYKITKKEFQIEKICLPPDEATLNEQVKDQLLKRDKGRSTRTIDF
ncbi:elongator complex protein 4-like isoform X1 [Schistocerca gregaria]|uniref:elongator complex protein 4-like isoform X1 n=1 Tax=Schistocerca gregaria TaxID=7010 RepID=UPI00211DDA94|nr:elongator complex protein 4-like isoform X1 [Schistocerca gregaria]